MNYKLLFMDVDGTLKQEPYGISEINKKSIIKACQAGKKVSIASGRNRDLILPTVKDLKLNQYGDSYTVALNGAHIIENSTGNTLHTEPIPLDLTKILFEKAYQYEISCHVYTENMVYFNYQDFQYEWYEKGGCHCDLVNMSDSSLGLAEIPLKFFLICKDRPKLDKYKEELEPIISNILNAEYSSIYTLEYTSVNASKGLGMKFVCDLFNTPLSHAIAVGDGENDISMLKMAGLGIAMKNALDSVKAFADLVTNHTCKEDGVSEVINEHLLV